MSRNLLYIAITRCASPVRRRRRSARALDGHRTTSLVERILRELALSSLRRDGALLQNQCKTR
jgi:hypothetical protein